MNNVLSISGGKDSTAMAILMKERGEPIHSMIFFDTGWEFPAMYPHIDQLEQFMGQRIWRLHSRLPFDYWLTERPVIATDGPNKGRVHMIGNGWPSSSRRWCTREKVAAIDQFCKPIPSVARCVGYALDEPNRVDPLTGANGIIYRYPLREHGVTEADALKICYDHGFYWGGLYQHFNRVSCFCCPLQRLGELRKLRKHFPELWERMLRMDSAIPVNIGFREYDTVHDLERRFAGEDLELELQGGVQPLFAYREQEPGA